MDEQFDFVVVGSGGGGLCAALVMASLGKSVLVLEKSEYAGGVTAASGGVMWIPNNRFLAEAGIQDSHDDALAYLDALIGGDTDAPGATAERRRTFVEQAPRMLEFLIGQGLAFRRVPFYPDYYDDLPGVVNEGRTVVSQLFDAKKLGPWEKKLRPGFLPIPANLDEAMMLPRLKANKQARKTLVKVLLRTVGSRLTGKHLVTAGNALQAQMLYHALQAGAQVRLETPVEEILVEGGRATGVITGGKRIGAKLGVLIAAGGFVQNQAMRDRYIPGTSKDWTLAPKGENGEMIEVAAKHGAALAQMDARVCHPTTIVPGKGAASVHGDIAKPHGIVIDQSGKRYMSEAGCYMDICAAMLAHHKKTPAVPSWLIMDSQYIGKYMLAGSRAGAKKPAEWTESGFLKTGETINALADACGIDPSILASTVARFNALAKQGEDEDFGRGKRLNERWLGDQDSDAPTLGAIEQGPFYAIPVYPGDVDTFGGIVTDTSARVLDGDGNAIDGLYATGTSTASVMGRTSPGPGSSIGPAFTWGYVAAAHAANADNLLGGDR
ncbi:FAD-dependent oxidoreductase [Stakelama tenebrarum]|uniref:FAD-dependent oxidoreductase n=1 Tax=Stakelama tenebrarum TaxID=2711215 RepID=A0A6G6Y747_9SPHN|nr:FAD-dependent oxidoreductase [Sphingosinithalassobacter tenebrarum]QIG80745.1 FAD-dependent oxidoreductase [Sphingosinithalassobacter tenebrarum]